MARESALWKRLKDAVVTLALNNLVDLQRLENAVGVGHPDVEGCIAGQQVWIELKSCLRPARETTSCRVKKRQSQTDWHRIRTSAGFRHHWFLIQVGEAHTARLYLIPGRDADLIIATESDLALLSVLGYQNPRPHEVLLRAAQGWG